MASKPPPLPPRPTHLPNHVPHHVPHHVPIPLSKSIHCMGAASQGMGAASQSMGIQGMETENTIHVQSPRTILSILQENTI